MKIMMKKLIGIEKEIKDTEKELDKTRQYFEQLEEEEGHGWTSQEKLSTLSTMQDLADKLEELLTKFSDSLSALSNKEAQEYFIWRAKRQQQGQC